MERSNFFSRFFAVFSRIACVAALLLVASVQASPPARAYPGYTMLYKEQLYQLVQQRLYMYPENFAENILWLEETLRADFANPLNALATIRDERDWQWYRNLFLMHVNLLLVKQYLGWAVGYMKFDARFYNAPWRDMTIRSMQKARRLVEYAQTYWSEALKYVEAVRAMKLNFFSMPRIQNWEDEYYRILRKDLPYSSRAIILS